MGTMLVKMTTWNIIDKAATLYSLYSARYVYNIHFVGDWFKPYVTCLLTLVKSVNFYRMVTNHYPNQINLKILL